MTEENKTPKSGEANRAEAEKNPDKIPLPSEGIVLQVIQRIKNEPFLFVIAIVALLIGLAIPATTLASPDLRFLITVIAILTFIVILGYYTLEGWKLYSKRQTPPTRESNEAAPLQQVTPISSIRGEVKAGELSGDVQLGGVKATKEALNYQGDIEGKVDVEKATGGHAFGVEIGEDKTGKPD
jgi:membrane protein implicated in regulation of membrane protease activity